MRELGHMPDWEAARAGTGSHARLGSSAAGEGIDASAAPVVEGEGGVCLVERRKGARTLPLVLLAGLKSEAQLCV